MTVHSENVMTTKTLVEQLLGRPSVREECIDHRLIEDTEKHLKVTLPKALRAFYLTAGANKLFLYGPLSFLLPRDLVVDHDCLFFLHGSEQRVFWGMNRITGKIVTKTSVGKKTFSNCNLNTFLRAFICKQAITSDWNKLAAANGKNDYYCILEQREFLDNPRSKAYVEQALTNWTPIVNDQDQHVLQQDENSMLFFCSEDYASVSDYRVLIRTNDKEMMERLVDKLGFWRLLSPPKL